MECYRDLISDTPKGVRVKNASGILQGSQLLQTGLQRCCDGLAKGESSPRWPSTKKGLSYRQVFFRGCDYRGT